MGRIWVGTSGYAYGHWRGLFYPPDLRPVDWLAHYGKAFACVELNATFYRLASRDAAARWAAQTPPGFLFSAKGSRYLTHMKRLRDPDPGLARFLEPLAPLGRKLQVALWQLPPRFAPDLDRLDTFLAALPRRLRHAVEFRDPAWYQAAVCDVLDHHGAAFCEHDLVARPPPRLTGGFRYVRFHGTSGHGGRYGAAELAPWARDLARSAARGDAFVFFNNDVGGHAVRDALALAALLGDGAQPEASP